MTIEVNENTELQFKNSHAIVSTEWLAANINLPNIRIFDCTTYLDYSSKSEQPYKVISGLCAYKNDHIPGAGFLDIHKNLSDNNNPFLFAIPSMDKLAASFGLAGIGDNTRVILYARENPQWATRVWWMLHYLGFNNVAILDGGIIKWTMEGRALTSGNEHYSPAQLTVKTPRQQQFVGKNVVLSAINKQEYCIIDALSEQLHSGESCRYGRRGCIPSSVNVPATSLVELNDTRLISAQRASAIFESLGINDTQKIITYCGSGIWGAMVAFMLYLLGYNDIAVYDNSMSEWAQDKNLPMEVEPDFSST